MARDVPQDFRHVKDPPPPSWQACWWTASCQTVASRAKPGRRPEGNFNLLCLRSLAAACCLLLRDRPSLEITPSFTFAYRNASGDEITNVLTVESTLVGLPDFLPAMHPCRILSAMVSRGTLQP